MRYIQKVYNTKTFINFAQTSIMAWCKRALEKCEGPKDESHHAQRKSHEALKMVKAEKKGGWWWLHLACDHWKEHSAKNSWKGNVNKCDHWEKHSAKMWTKHHFPLSSNPIWRWDKWPGKQITPGCWQYGGNAEMHIEYTKHFSHFEDSEIAQLNAAVNPHRISFPLMLHRWCPCCQLGWRIICIIHQKPGVDLTLKQFLKREKLLETWKLSGSRCCG